MNPARRATIFLLATTVLWGSSFLTMSLGTAEIAARLGGRAAPSAFLFLRFLVALLVQAAVVPRALGALTGRTLGAGLVLSLPFYAGFVLQVTGLATTTSTVSAFLTSLFVVLTPLLGRLFFGERLAGPTLLGAFVSLGGVYLLTDPAGGIGRGELLTLACALAFALQIQLTNLITRKHPPESITLVQFAAAVVFSGISLAAMGVGPGDLARCAIGRQAAWTVPYTGIACSVVAVGVLNRYQRDLSATRASVLYMMEPVFAAVFAVIGAGEVMTARKIAGGSVILMGNLVCELIGRRAGERTNP